MKYYETKTFKALNKKWENKLKNSGFEDIEQDEFRLKVWSKKVFGTKRNGEYYEDKKEIYNLQAEYYRRAEHLLHTYPFKTTTDKYIWELHSQGVSIRSISADLKKRNIKINAYKDYIHKLIKTIRKVMTKEVTDEKE